MCFFLNSFFPSFLKSLLKWRRRKKEREKGRKKKNQSAKIKLTLTVCFFFLFQILCWRCNIIFSETSSLHTTKVKPWPHGNTTLSFKCFFSELNVIYIFFNSYIHISQVFFQEHLYNKSFNSSKSNQRRSLLTINL